MLYSDWLPQVLVVILLTVRAIAAVYCNGQRVRFNALPIVANTLILLALMALGGFFNAVLYQ